MDADLKRQFEAFCADMGMTMTTAFNVFARKANAFSDDIRQAKEAGMNEHIAKPIDVSVMFSVLSDWMNDKRENP